MVELTSMIVSYDDGDDDDDERRVHKMPKWQWKTIPNRLSQIVVTF
jgi:hypothetical protein